MLNGRNHSAARKGLTVNGRGSNAVAEADASALYGEYEQKLASELAELLKSGSGPPRVATAPVSGTTRGSLSSSPPVNAGNSSAPALVHPLAMQASGAHQVGLQPGSLQRSGSGRQRSFAPAVPPINDFATDGIDQDPLPFSWRHEPRPAQPSWIARQMRAGMLGLVAGLIVVLPAVAVLSGRLDTALPSRKSPVAERAPRLYEVPMSPPKVAAMQPVALSAAPVELPAPSAVVSRGETVPAVRQSFGAVASPKSEPGDAPAIVSRSVGTVEAFPPGGAGVSSVKQITPPAAMAALPPSAALAPRAPPVDDAVDLLALGLRLVKDGDIAGARTPLARAANLGNGEAMLALGETFDPNMLAAWGALDVKSDASSARLFYGRAAAAGQSRAKARLDALN